MHPYTRDISPFPSINIITLCLFIFDARVFPFSFRSGRSFLLLFRKTHSHNYGLTYLKVVLVTQPILAFQIGIPSTCKVMRLASCSFSLSFLFTLFTVCFHTNLPLCENENFINMLHKTTFRILFILFVKRGHAN